MLTSRHTVKAIVLFSCITIGLAVPVDAPQHQLNVTHAVQSGGWGNWSEWSRCSQVCGSGVSCQERQCNNDTCFGSRRRYRSCNVQPCSSGQPNLRVSQCAEFNHVASDGSARVWIPLAMANENQCHLVCRLNGTNETAVLKNSVIDGTKCANGHGVCIDGRCLRLGCDGVLGSDKVLDKCGRCLHPQEVKNISNTCRQFVGQNLLKDLRKGYNSVVNIPSGATLINITTLGAYRNFIRVRSHTKDGQEEAVFSQEAVEAVVAGAHFKLVQLNTCASCVEQWAILGEGINTESLEVEVFGASVNHGILYSYFSVRFEGHREKEEVGSGFRLSRGKRQLEHYCSQYGSRYVWGPAPPTPCSVTCGNGTRTTRYQCFEREGNQINVHEVFCQCQEKPAPINEVCEKPTCASRWQAGSWESCSTSCGTGVRHRQVQCLQRVSDMESIQIPDHQCDQASRPPSSEMCQAEQCTAQWRTSEWLKCDGACGENLGTQSRIVLCYTTGGQATNNSECDGQAKPSSIRPCSINCSQVSAWDVSDWSQCSAKCGTTGNRTRVVTCVVERGQENFIGLDELCPFPKPATIELCRAFCSWTTTEWKTCSKTCGGGVQTRDVSCVNSLGLQTTGCSQKSKPVTEQSCNAVACPCINSEDPSWCRTVIVEYNMPCRQVERHCCNHCRQSLSQ